MKKTRQRLIEPEEQEHDLKRSEPTDANPMKIDLVEIATLKLDPANARRGDVDEIGASLRRFGQHRVVVVRRADNVVIAGNHLIKAAKAAGWKRVNVYFVDDDEPTAIARGIADNAVGDRASWDNDQLAEQIAKASTEAIPGIDEDFMKALQEEPRLERMSIKETPTMAWVLIGVPIEQYGDVQAAIAPIIAMPDALVETSHGHKGGKTSQDDEGDSDE